MAPSWATADYVPHHKNVIQVSHCQNTTEAPRAPEAGSGSLGYQPLIQQAILCDLTTLSWLSTFLTTQNFSEWERLYRYCISKKTSSCEVWKLIIQE